MMSIRSAFVAAAKLLLGAAAVASVVSCFGPRLPDGLYAELDTTKGSITISLDYRLVPLAVTNFVGLAEGKIASAGGNKPFYDGLSFHRVVKGFIIQSGDPTGTGSGGPGYTFPDEIVPTLRHDAPGVVAMANRGPNTNGSQFYITLEPAPWLDGHYTIFGHVVRGMDVVRSIVQGDLIKQVKIIRVGSEAKAFTVDQASFDRLRSIALDRDREAADAREAADLALIKAKWPKAIETPDGVRYIVERRGVGTVTPRQGSEVTISYIGEFLDGKEFASTAKEGKPLTFQIGETIRGLNEMLLTMRKGEKRLVIVPPQLAYGDNGIPGRIPPDSYLVFDVELLSFK